MGDHGSAVEVVRHDAVVGTHVAKQRQRQQFTPNSYTCRAAKHVHRQNLRDIREIRDIARMRDSAPCFAFLVPFLCWAVDGSGSGSGTGVWELQDGMGGGSNPPIAPPKDSLLRRCGSRRTHCIDVHCFRATSSFSVCRLGLDRWVPTARQAGCDGRRGGHEAGRSCSPAAWSTAKRHQTCLSLHSWCAVRTVWPPI